MAELFPTKILMASDDSECAAVAARVAGEVARKTGSEVHVVYVYPLLAFAAGQRLDEDVYKEIRQDAQDLLDEQVRRIEEEGATVAQAHLRVGRPDEEIIALGEELSTNLIVLGSRGSGPLRRLIGNVSDNVVRNANCPVLVVRRPKEPERGRPESERAAQNA
jgi:nucleotide-binding universal stress UspA family protein